MSIILEDVDEEEVTIYVAAAMRFSPGLARWIVHSNNPESDLVGTEVSFTKWNCLGQVQQTGGGQIVDSGREEFYDVKWTTGEFPFPCEGVDPIRGVQVTDRTLAREFDEPDRTATTDHEGQVSRFGGLCGDVAKYVLP